MLQFIIFCAAMVPNKFSSLTPKKKTFRFRTNCALVSGPQMKIPFQFKAFSDI